MSAAPLAELELAAFQRDGYVVRPGLATAAECDRLLGIAQAHLDAQIAPIEYEVDVDYPGSPAGPDAEGASTSRRLLQAYARHEAFRDWATGGPVTATLTQLFASSDVWLSQCHHNCMMTKMPGYSSVTLWHQDNRYWHFDREDLVSVWLALGDESKSNGCLRVIPGSHQLELAPGRFDAARFLRPELPANKALLGSAEMVPLEKGDVLFFHSRLFHAAGRNLSTETKFSLVFTYHEGNNHPIAGTRSARFPSIRLPG